MLSAMARNATALERAFQLARSGDYGTIKDIRKRLRAEGYPSMQIAGSALIKQLRAIIRTARDAKAKNDPPT